MEDVVQLVHLGKCFQGPSFSPFSIKLYIYFQLNRISFRTDILPITLNPKKKLPFVFYKDKLFSDSTLIVHMCEKESGRSLDAWLTSEEKSISRAFQSMIEEDLYFHLLECRWKNPRNWQRYRKEFYPSLSKLGYWSFLHNFLLWIARKGVLSSHNGQGTGRFTEGELAFLSQKKIDALADFLGDNMFFFGEQPSNIDATLLAFLYAFLVPLPSYVQEQIQGHSNLMAYVERNQHFFEVKEEFLFS